tara:strand:- start:310 stop:996 length:687 start_codon:yes stop_codon:yes gene_type:complete
MKISNLHITCLSLLFLVFSSSNAQSKQDGTLRIIGDYNAKTISEISKRYAAPLVIISNKIYLPEASCLETRLLNGDKESRSLGGDKENRSLGGDKENRSLGGDKENRSLGGDKENRSLGGDKENRSLGGDKENRSLGGDKENRSLGGDKENRSLGGDKENRSLGGDKENRSLGGDKENRSLGGDVMALTCYKLKDKTGFKILNVNPNAIIYVYYQNQLKQIQNQTVEY